MAPRHLGDFRRVVSLLARGKTNLLSTVLLASAAVFLAACDEEDIPTFPPEAPTGLQAAVTPAGVALTWVDQSREEDGYTVLRARGLDPMEVIVELPANTQQYLDPGRPSGTWNYMVNCWNNHGRSDNSNVVTATVP